MLVAAAVVAIVIGAWALVVEPAQRRAVVERAAAEAPIASQQPSVESVSPTSQATGSPEFAEARELVTGTSDLIVSVLGDSTGNGPGEWVDLWSEHLGASGAVSLYFWGDNDAYPASSSKLYGSGSRKVTVWDGSKAGSTGAYPLERMASIQPAKPDLILYNYGHNRSANGVVSDIKALQRKAEDRWGKQIPFVVMLQNPARGERAQYSAASVQELRAWARLAGIPAVDIEAAFNKAGADALLADNVHPNSEGSKLWAETLVQAIG